MSTCRVPYRRRSLLTLALCSFTGCFSESASIEIPTETERGDSGTGESDSSDSTQGDDTTSGDEGLAEESSGSDDAEVDAPPVLERFTVNGQVEPAAMTAPDFVVLEVQATDDRGIEAVEFRDGVQTLASVTSAPYEFRTLVSARDNGAHAYTARVIDSGGHTTGSDPIALSIELPPGGTEVASSRAAAFRMNDLETDAAGNVVLAGWVDHDDEDDDIWVAKLGPDAMQLLWEQTFDGEASEGDRAAALDVAQDGDVVVAGFDRKGQLDTDVWVTKLDAAGSLRWTVRHEGSAGGIDRATDVAIASGGEVVVVGLETDANAGERAWMGSYGPDGSPVWSGPVLADEGTVELHGVTSAGADWVIVGGRSSPMSEEVIWGRRIDAAGETLWTREVAGSLGGSSSASRVDSAGEDVVVAGRIHTASGGLDVWVGRFDVQGDLLWQTALDAGIEGVDAGADEGVDVAVGPDGSISVAATLTGADPGSEFRVIRLLGSGQVDWTRTYDEAGDDLVAKGVGIDPRGYVWGGADLFLDALRADRLIVRLSP